MQSIETNLEKSNILPKETPRAEKIKLLEHMMISREAENRENILFRQGRGQFHLSSAGHEGMAAIAPLIRNDDWFYCYYRDRALLLAMGVPLEEMALSFFAKKQTSSGGRQMSSHFSYKPLNVVSCATPTALQCLPAVGTAWAFKKEKNRDVVFCSIGDASTRQGEFFEAVAFAMQEKLPIIFMVEDNGYGISTPTEELSPLKLGMIPQQILHVMDGSKPESFGKECAAIVDEVRNGAGPKLLWIKMPRLMSHTSSDDQSKYRSEEELAEDILRDPLKILKDEIIQDGIMEHGHIACLEKEVFENVKNTYALAEKAASPSKKDATTHIFSDIQPSKHSANAKPEGKFPSNEWSMANAFNCTLEQILSENPKAIVFGEDVEDPKGGVFGLTRNLSTKYPEQVINSPLAEATIAGLASGLAMKGYLPIFELQFIDFIGPAFNQIVNQIATLRWRSIGQYKCPLVIYAPCGSYISGGGPWHSQTNESWLAHAPGLKTYMPSNANDASNMLYDAAHGDDPVLMLLPKNQFQKTVPIEYATTLYPEKAHIRKTGVDISLVAWGNCVEVALDAAQNLKNIGIECEVIDIPSIMPCDFQMIKQSVMKTGRLIVIQEDNETCSFGQSIITKMTSDLEVWNAMYTPPQLLSRQDVHIGFSPILEQAVLPNTGSVINASKSMLGGYHG